MNGSLRMLSVLAHPDDESLGTGGIQARYAAEGVETYLITATRGQRGWFGDEAAYPGPENLGRMRERELLSAAEVLGIREVTLLDYMDGELDQADPVRGVEQLAAHIRRIRPQVVVTFDPYGYYGHPDHIAISQWTTAAVVAAASIPALGSLNGRPHRVSKLYYLAAVREAMESYQAAFGELVMNIDGGERRIAPWPEWAVTTRIDTRDYWPAAWEAVSRHRSQLPGYRQLLELSAEHHRNLWGTQTLYRAFSLVNGGRAIETDLFEGIRESEMVK